MRTKTLLTIIAVAAGMAMNAHAILLTPGDAVLTGNNTDQPGIDAAIAAHLGFSVEHVYKNDFGGSDSGPAAAYYNTTYGDPLLDDNDATITWVGPQAIAPGNPSYFLIKDGKAEPAWYFFEANWNGMEVVQFAGFWPTRGDDAISHVSIYGGEDDCCDIPGVPDAGASLMLLGLTLVGVEGFRRRMK